MGPGSGTARLISDDRSYELNPRQSPVKVGSDPASAIALSDRMVSRSHATLQSHDGSWLLADAGSTNGTYVNNQRIDRATALRDGDQVRFGPIAFTYRSDARGSIPSQSCPIVAALATLTLAALAFLVYAFLGNFADLELAGLSSNLAPAIPSPSIAMTEATSAAISATPATAPTAALATVTPLPIEHGSKPWLDALNRYRAGSGLPPLPDNPRFSPGAELHSRYVVINYGDQIKRGANLGALMHTEDPSKPGFTKLGLQAGRSGDVDEIWHSTGIVDPSWAIDNWMEGPFHRLSLLDAHLHSVGYGAYCEAGVCVATLNVHGDEDVMLSEPNPLPKPVAYPPDGATITTTSFTGEWPDPIASCPEYSLPAGYAISLQLGPLVTPDVGSYALTLAGASPSKIEACEFDANNFKGADQAGEKLGRELLKNYGAMVILPRHPLAPGKYTITIAADRSYSWSFTVAANRASSEPPP